MSGPLLASFIVASFLVIIAPGPASFFILRRCEGPLSDPIKGVAGIVAGDVVLICLSGIGVASLLTRFPTLAEALKLAGAAYVAWLGWQALRAPAATASTMPQRPGSSFAQGLMLTISNPKPILFFAAFFPLFMAAGDPAGVQFIKLGALFEIVNLSFYAAFIIAVRQLFRRLSPDQGRLLNVVSGAGLLGAGILGAVAMIIELGR